MTHKKVIILDFDGTFYSGEKVFSKLKNYIKSNQREFFPRLSDEEYDLIVKENPAWKDAYVGSEIVDGIYAFKKKYPEFDISIKDFLNWQNENPDPLNLKGANVIDADFVEALCKKYHVYVVSNSSPTHIEFYMQKFGINPDWFVQVVSNKFTFKDRTKKHYYENILEKENCKASNIYVFGDSVKSDLIPAQELNMNICHVTEVCELEAALKKLFKV